MPTRVTALRGGAADVDILIEDDLSSFTIVHTKGEDGDDRLLTGRNAGGHQEFRAHKAPTFGGIYELTPDGDLSVPPG